MSTRTLLAALATCGVVVVAAKTLIDTPVPKHPVMPVSTVQTTHIGVSWDVERAMIGGAQADVAAH